MATIVSYYVKLQCNAAFIYVRSERLPEEISKMFSNALIVFMYRYFRGLYSKMAGAIVKTKNMFTLYCGW